MESNETFKNKKIHNIHTRDTNGMYNNIFIYQRAKKETFRGDSDDSVIQRFMFEW